MTDPFKDYPHLAECERASKTKPEKCPHDVTERQGGQVVCADCFHIVAAAQPEEPKVKVHEAPDIPPDPIGMGWRKCIHDYWLPSLDLCPASAAAQPEEKP